MKILPQRHKVEADLTFLILVVMMGSVDVACQDAAEVLHGENDDGYKLNFIEDRKGRRLAISLGEEVVEGRRFSRCVRTEG